MADDLKVSNSSGGVVPQGAAAEMLSPVSPEEPKFETYVSRERARGSTASEESLRRTFQVKTARAARAEGNIQSSRAHYQSLENETVEEGGSAERDTTASLIGAQSDVSAVSGLTEEQERDVAGGRLGSQPTLPPTDSPQITSDQAYEFLGTTFSRHRERNGQSLELETVLRESESQSDAPVSSSTGGVVRSGTGAGALSMRIGGGGANLASTSSSTSDSRTTQKYSNALKGTGYNWPNLERELVLFMLREAKDNPELRRLLKGLRTESGKSSLAGRELDKTVTEVRQFTQKMRMAQQAIESGERASQGVAQSRADGVTGKIADDDPTQSLTDKEAHANKLRAKMAGVVDQVEKQKVSEENPTQDPDDIAHLKEVPRTMLTADELTELKEKQPELHKQYESALQEYRNFYPSFALASLKQNQALLPEDKQAEFNEPIQELESLVTERSRGAFSDARGFGMVEFNRSQLYNKVQGMNQDLHELRWLPERIEELKAEEGNEAVVAKLEAKLAAKRAKLEKKGAGGVEALHKYKHLLMESIHETDRRLAAHRPLTPKMIESQEENRTRQKEDLEKKVPDLKKKVAELEEEWKNNPTEKNYGKLNATRFQLREIESTTGEVMDYMDRMYDSMKDRRMLGETDDVDSSSEDGKTIVITENDDLPTDMDKRHAELEIRIRAGAQFLNEKDGLFDLRGERRRDMIIGHLDRGLDKLASPWQGALAKAAGGTIGDAKANSKQAGGMIRAVENVQDMTSRLMGLADQARKMRG